MYRVMPRKELYKRELPYYFEEFMLQDFKIPCIKSVAYYPFCPYITVVVIKKHVIVTKCKWQDMIICSIPYSVTKV